MKLTTNDTFHSDVIVLKEAENIFREDVIDYYRFSFVQMWRSAQTPERLDCQMFPGCHNILISTISESKDLHVSSATESEVRQTATRPRQRR